MQSLFRALSDRLERRTISLPENDLDLDHRWRLVRKYGDFPLAYPLVTESYLSAFATEMGAVSYAQKMGFTFALGDPLCADEDHERLLKEFVSAFETPTFVASRQHTAMALSKLGYSVNVLGYDSILDLPGHSFAGGTYKRVRYGSNRLEGNGGYVAEAMTEGIPTPEIREMTAQWRKTRVAIREVQFLNRRFTPKPEEGVRRFYAFDADGKALGLINFDPLYAQDKVIGYLASQKRRFSNDTAYLDLAIMHRATEAFRDEGLDVLHLGISPLADVHTPEFAQEKAWLRRALAYAHESDRINRKYFNSRGLVEYKNRFRGRREPLYLCLPPNGQTWLRLLGLLVLVQIV